MADQYSARPTGESVPFARSGLSLKTTQLLGFALNKRAIGSILLFIAGLHIGLTDIATNTSANPIWPTLALGYGLLFATLIIYERRQLPPSQNFISENQASLMSMPLQSTSQDTRSSDGKIPALTHTPRLSQAKRQACSDWSDLMSQVSHELRTPLNAMIGFSDVMNAELLGPLENPKYREYLAHIRDSGQELLKSAEDTLAMTSLLANRPAFEHITQTSNLRDTLIEAWCFVAVDADTKSITLELDCDANLHLNADTRALKQTFVNLFSEALKRTCDEGTITVSAQQSGEVAEIQVATKCTKPPQSKTAPSLSVAIAQALLELQGTTLVTAVNSAGMWSALTLFECPTQSDFFSDELYQRTDKRPAATDTVASA